MHKMSSLHTILKEFVVSIGKVVDTFHELVGSDALCLYRTVYRVNLFVNNRDFIVNLVDVGNGICNHGVTGVKLLGCGLDDRYKLLDT